MARSWAAYILPVVVIGGGIALYWHKEGTPPATPSVPSAAPSAAASGAPTAAAPVALLEGLAPIDGWVVDRIFVNQSHTNKPQLAVELTSGGTGVTIWVARKENVTMPPATTQRYALTYGDLRPLGANVPQAVIDRLLNSIAELVKRNEVRAPVPDGI